MWRKIFPVHVLSNDNVLIFFEIAEDSEKEDNKDKEKERNGRPAHVEKVKQKEVISRYGSFYLRLGAIGKLDFCILTIIYLRIVLYINFTSFPSYLQFSSHN